MPEAIEYVNRHLADPDLTAERVADALFISRRRPYQLFDDGDGISGRIRRMRIERAKELLADPARARAGIGELARQCGFVNSAHFSRTFGKSSGRRRASTASGQPSKVTDATSRPNMADSSSQPRPVADVRVNTAILGPPPC